MLIKFLTVRHGGNLVVDEKDRLRRIRQLEAEQATALAKAAAEDAKYVRDPNTGLSPAQVDANKAVAAAAASSNELGLPAVVVKTRGASDKVVTPPSTAPEGTEWKWVGSRNTDSVAAGSWVLQKTATKPVTTVTTDNTDNTDNTGYKVVNGILLFNGQPFSGTYNGQTYENGKVKTTDNGNNNNNLNTDTSDLIKSLQAQIANLTTNNAATEAAKKLAERQSAFDVLRAEMDALGLGALVEPLRGLIQKDVGAAEFAIQLRQSEAYKNRFIANEGRLKKGLRVLTPGEYLRVEDAYRQTLRTYGLKQFDNDQYVRQFIENDISAKELSDRVSTAVQRVQNADPAISRTLRDYYGIGQTDLVAYVLDPNQQLQKIERQVAAAEIGTAARIQGLEAGVTVSEQLAAQGISQAQAQKGYATIADILPTSEKLSQIYGTTLEGYGQVEAEQEVFNTLASAQRKRQRLIGREAAEFSGQTGVTRGSLGTSTGGQY
jgi:hypothetical protein